MLMGYVGTEGLLGDGKKTRVEEVEFLADSGSFYPIIPPELAQRLGIEPLLEVKAELVLADNRRVRVPISIAYFKLLDREGPFQVVIMDVPEPVLGVTVFEGLGIKIDPATGKLEYSRPYGLAAI
jgi:predicted aspartyl protease